MDDKLNWCFGKKEVKFIEPNLNIAREYIKSAEETLVVLKNIDNKSNMWLATTKYYCEYFAAYSLLMRLGIKSEIHDCTIEIIRDIENIGILNTKISKNLEEDKELRIDNQYYLKNREVVIEFNKLRDYILEIKELVNTISYEKVNEVRQYISSSLQHH